MTTTNPTMLQRLADDGQIRDHLEYYIQTYGIDDATAEKLLALPEQAYAAVLYDLEDLELNTDNDDLDVALDEESSRAKNIVITTVLTRLADNNVIERPGHISFDIDGTDIYVDESTYSDVPAIFIGDEDYELTANQAQRWIDALTACVDNLRRRQLRAEIDEITAATTTTDGGQQ